MSNKKSKKIFIPEMVGANGFQIGFDEDGNMVEWIPDEENEGQEWPNLLLRNEDDISNACDEFWNKVWWNRHQNWLIDIKNGKVKLTEAQKPILRRAKAEAKKVEMKYGMNNLGWNDFEWGELNGKLSALAWVLGAEWEDSLDT